MRFDVQGIGKRTFFPEPRTPEPYQYILTHTYHISTMIESFLRNLKNEKE